MFLKKLKNAQNRYFSKSVNYFYPNPVCFAKLYQKMIDSGEVKTQTDLSTKLGISKVCISHYYPA